MYIIHTRSNNLTRNRVISTATFAASHSFAFFFSLHMIIRCRNMSNELKCCCKFLVLHGFRIIFFLLNIGMVRPIIVMKKIE